MEIADTLKEMNRALWQISGVLERMTGTPGRKKEKEETPFFGNGAGTFGEWTETASSIKGGT